MVVVTLSCHATWTFPPWTHFNLLVTIIDRIYLCSTLVLGGSTHFLNYIGCENPVCIWAGDDGFHPVLSWYLAFPPWTHLNSSVTIVDRLYLCSTLVLGGSTHFMELYWHSKQKCLGQSWWVSPCPVVLLGSSLHGPTSFCLLQFEIGYICVPHWCWVVALISWNCIGSQNRSVWAGHGRFHPVLLCYLALLSMDPPHFVCYNCR
jgi:hypothetical protein